MKSVLKKIISDFHQFLVGGGEMRIAEELKAELSDAN